MRANSVYSIEHVVANYIRPNLSASTIAFSYILKKYLSSYQCITRAAIVFIKSSPNKVFEIVKEEM